jgi:hypothetical protein
MAILAEFSEIVREVILTGRPPTAVAFAARVHDETEADDADLVRKPRQRSV